MNKTFIPPIFVMSATLMLSGCSTPPYIEPQSGKTAEMVMQIQPAIGTLYYLNTFENAESCSGEQVIVSDANRVTISKFKFAAEKPISLHYLEMQGRAYCSMKFGFFGKSDHIYLLNGLTTTGRCSVQLWDVTDLKTKVPVAMITNREKGSCPKFKY